MTKSERIKLGAEALRRNRIKATHQMYNAQTGGRCCMCVLLDCAIENGFEGKHFRDAYDFDREYAKWPHLEMFEWYGIEGDNPLMRDGMSFSSGNDSTLDNNHKKLAEEWEALA